MKLVVQQEQKTGVEMRWRSVLLKPEWLSARMLIERHRMEMLFVMEEAESVGNGWVVQLTRVLSAPC